MIFSQKWEVTSEHKVKNKNWKKSWKRTFNACLNVSGKCGLLFFNSGLEVHTLLDFQNSSVKYMLGGKTFLEGEQVIHSSDWLLQSKYHDWQNAEAEAVHFKGVLVN